MVAHTTSSEIYDRVAEYPCGDFEFHCGATYAHELLGYDARALRRLPRLATACFAGVGQPLSLAPVESGQTVLDVGCGGGTDVLLAANRVGPRGSVVGVDVTRRMVERARTAAAQTGADHVEIREGNGAALPVGDSAVEVVICNGMLHLARDVAAIAKEIARVLAPGGRLLLSDIVVEKGPPASGWLADSDTQDTLLANLRNAGLVDVRVQARWDPFPGCSTESVARQHGARSVGVTARKAVS